MDNGLIVIIGVGKDLGISIAKVFGRKGYDIVLMGRNTGKIKSQASVLSSEDINFHIIETDITDIESVNAAFIKIRDLRKPVDCMIYNAVSRSHKKPSELTIDDLSEDLKVNICGAVACTNKILGIYKTQNSGSIIFTGGGVALSPLINYASMSIGKAALRNYAVNLHNEMKDNNIFIGIITISSYIEEGTDYSPRTIANLYYKMFSERTETEIII